MLLSCIVSETQFRNRRAWQLENNHVRVTLLAGGGHVAEILHKESGVNPLWIPPWPSIEPGSFDPARHRDYGKDAESRLLAGIMGHNLCLDLFGGPSEEEAAAGMSVHGEASVASYTITKEAGALRAVAGFPEARLRFERRIRLTGAVVRFTEIVENLAAWDHPVAWTQHVTLGPPFLERGQTQFRAPATRSKVLEVDFAGAHGWQKTGAEFDWPLCPRKTGGALDLRVYPDLPASAGFSTHLMDPHREHAFFLAWSPASRVLFGYAWKRADFPWLGRWEENHSRTHAPWNGVTMTCGMEFGASPMPETRRRMVERGSLFGVPGYRWIPARARVEVDYCAFIVAAASIPGSVVWDGGERVLFEN